MNTRLKQFIAAENITQAQFADSINVVRASVSHILAGRNKPGYEFIAGLMRHYPDLNIEWLMFGKGKMYKDSKTTVAEDPEVGYGNLFEEAPSLNETPVQESQTAQESRISVQCSTPSAQDASLNEIKTLINTLQKPVNQRKLIKITAFFDDGTFQELTSI